MSKTKFLGIPAGGNRAGWIEMEGGSSAGGGGGVLVVKVDKNLVADTSNFEIVEAVAAGKQVVLIDDSDGQNRCLIPLVLCTNGMAIFSAALNLTGTLTMLTYTMTYPNTQMEKTISNLATATT